MFSLEEVKAEYSQIESQLMKLYKRNTDEREDDDGKAEQIRLLQEGSQLISQLALIWLKGGASVEIF